MDGSVPKPTVPQPDPEGVAALKQFYVGHIVWCRMTGEQFAEVPQVFVSFGKVRGRRKHTHILVLQHEFEVLQEEGVL